VSGVEIKSGEKKLTVATPKLGNSGFGDRSVEFSNLPLAECQAAVSLR